DYNEALETTGYSPWIGLYPQWDVDWLVSSDDRMAQMSRDNADLGGRFPIYFREADHNAGTGHYFDNTGNSGPPNYTATGGSIDTYGHVVSANARQQVKLNMHDWAEFCQGAGADTVSITYPARSNNQFYNGI